MKPLTAVGVAVAVACAGLVCSARWIDVPENLHATMFLNRRDYYWDATAVFAESSERMFVHLFSNTGLADDYGENYWMLTDLVCTQNWGDGYLALYVMVRPDEGREGRAWWWPWQLVVVQNDRMYQIAREDILIGLYDVFSGRVYATMDGFIRLPEWIDTAQPFDIWYQESRVTIGSFDMASKTED